MRPVDVPVTRPRGEKPGPARRTPKAYFAQTIGVIIFVRKTFRLAPRDELKYR